jgi:hypothetical protein
MTVTRGTHWAPVCDHYEGDGEHFYPGQHYIGDPYPTYAEARSCAIRWDQYGACEGPHYAAQVTRKGTAWALLERTAA